MIARIFNAGRFARPASISRASRGLEKKNARGERNTRARNAKLSNLSKATRVSLSHKEQCIYIAIYSGNHEIRTKKKNKICFHVPWYIEARVAKAMFGRSQPIKLFNAVDCQSCDTSSSSSMTRGFCVIEVAGDLISLLIFSHALVLQPDLCRSDLGLAATVD